jgi:hypothetical protein
VSSPASLIGRILRIGGDSWYLPEHPFFIGFGNLLGHNQAGHTAYLMGKTSLYGWWYYFPVIFAIKTPLAVLALLFPSLWWILRARLRFEHRALAIPIVLYFLASLTSHLNIGYRHLLPILPFLYVLLAVAATNRLTHARTAFLAGILALHAWEISRIYPHYLAFFNAAVGGAANGPRYALDSNIDWGQDVKKLKTYANSVGAARLCIVYFGEANLEYYGLVAGYLPRSGEIEKRRDLDCLAAASVSPLYGLNTNPEDFRWLREMEPAARVGYSIYVYDLRRKK